MACVTKMYLERPCSFCCNDAVGFHTTGPKWYTYTCQEHKGYQSLKNKPWTSLSVIRAIAKKKNKDNAAKVSWRTGERNHTATPIYKTFSYSETLEFQQTTIDKYQTSFPVET
jgi:hypothetical protein